MAITLNDIKLNTTDKLVASVVDEFRRSNYLLANMPFDDTLLPTADQLQLLTVSRPALQCYMEAFLELLDAAAQESEAKTENEP